MIKLKERLNMQVGGEIIYILPRDKKKKIDESYKAYSLKAAVNG